MRVAGYQRLVVLRDIAETSLNRFVTVAYLKKQSRELFVEKNVLKNFTGKSCVGVSF